MGMTIIEKIFARASHQAKVAAGDLVVVDVDVSVMLDSSFHANHRRRILKVHDPEKIVVVYDHMVPAPDKMSAEAHVYGREFVKQFGIRRFHDVGPDQGISHAVVADRAYALPAASWCVAIPIPAPPVRSIAPRAGSGGLTCWAPSPPGRPGSRSVKPCATTWSASCGPAYRPRTSSSISRALTGTTPTRISSSAVSGLAHLGINARRTIATMGAELSAEFATFEADQTLLDYVRGRNPAPFEAQNPEPDARYVDRRTIDLDAMEPLVALPDTVIRNSVPVGDVGGRGSSRHSSARAPTVPWTIWPRRRGW